MRAVLMHEATTNYVTNPVAGVGTSGWATGANRTITRITTLPPGLPLHGVTTGVRVTANTTYGGAVGMLWQNVTVPSAGNYMLSAWVLIPDDWTGGTISLRSSVGGDWTGATGNSPVDADMSATGRWQRVIMGPVAIDAGDLVGSIGLQAEGWTSGQPLYVTGLMVHPGTRPVPFCPQFDGDGTLLDTYSWSGTAHASASSRTGGLIRLDAAGRINPDRGEIAVRFRTPLTLPDTGEQYVLAHSEGIFRNRILLAIYQGDLILTMGDGDTVTIMAVQPNTLMTLSVAWDGGTANVYVDGLPVLFGYHFGGIGATDSTMHVGSLSSASQLNGPILGVETFDQPLTDAERLALVGQDTWSWTGVSTETDQYSVRARTFSVVGDLHTGFTLREGNEERLDTAFADLATLKHLHGHRIYVGDLVETPGDGYSGTTPGEHDTEILARINALDPDRDTWDAVAGNHDLQQGRSADNWAAIYGYDDQNWVRDLGFCRIVAVAADDLASNPGKPQTLSSATLDWLDERLAEDHRDTIVLSHGTIRGTTTTTLYTGDFGGGYNGEAENMLTYPIDEVYEILDRHPHARLWLCGHAHTSPEAVGSITRQWTGSRYIAYVNASAINTVNHNVDSEDDPIRSLFLTLLDDRIDVRIRNHGTQAWDPIRGQYHVSLPRYTPPTGDNPTAFVFPLNDTLVGASQDGTPTLGLDATPVFTEVDGEAGLVLPESGYSLAYLNASQYLLPEAGSVVIRCAFATPTSSTSQRLLHHPTLDGSNRLQIYRENASGAPVMVIGGPATYSAGAPVQIADDEIVTLAIDWGDGEAILRVNGEIVKRRGYRGLWTFANSSSSLRFGDAGASTGFDGVLFGVAGFHRMLTGQEHMRLVTTPTDDWTFTTVQG